MINESDLTYENVKEFVEYTEDFFRGIDVGLIEGIIAMLEHAYETVKNDEPFSLDISTHKQIFAKEDPIDIIEKFYNTLSPTLGEMAHNLLRRATFKYDPNLLDSSNRVEFVLTRSYESIITAVHEVAHQFTFSRGYADMTTSITRLFCSEMETIYAELLCTDFLQTKHNYNSDLTEFRLYSLQNIYSEYLDYNLSKVEILKSLVIYLRFIRTTPLEKDNLGEHIMRIKDLDKQIMNVKVKDNPFFNVNLFYRQSQFNAENNPKGEFTAFDSFGNGGFIAHEVSFLLDCYLHQSVNMENPDKARNVFETLVKINSYSGDFEPEQINLIISLGLPFKEVDGKLSMDQEGVDKINQAFDNMHEQYIMKSSINTKLGENKNNSIRGKIIDAIKEAPLDKIDEAMARCGSDVAKKEVEVEVKT